MQGAAVVFEASVPFLLLAFEKGRPRLLTQNLRSAQQHALQSVSRADGRPSAAPSPRATCPARDHGDPMGPQFRRSSCLTNQLSSSIVGSPAQKFDSPESASRFTHDMGRRAHGGVGMGMGMGRGGEYGEDGQFQKSPPRQLAAIRQVAMRSC